LAGKKRGKQEGGPRKKKSRRSEAQSEGANAVVLKKAKKSREAKKGGPEMGDDRTRFHNRARKGWRET